MSLQDRLMVDLKTAMRAGDATRREAIRMLRAAIFNEELELQRQQFEARRPEGVEASADEAAVPREVLTDEQVLAVIDRLSKRHRDSIEQFRRGGRDDLVAHEEAQLAVIQAYLPRQLTRAEIETRARALIGELGARGRRDMGKVMPRLNQELRGRADSREVARVVQELLGA